MLAHRVEDIIRDLLDENTEGSILLGALLWDGCHKKGAIKSKNASLTYWWEKGNVAVHRTGASSKWIYFGSQAGMPLISPYNINKRSF